MTRRVEFLDPSDSRFGDEDERTEEEIEAESDAADDHAFESYRDEVIAEREANR